MSIGDLAVDRGADNKIKFGGKELQDYDLNGVNLALYDFHARHKMNDVPVFTTIDPLAEKMKSWSTYAYCFDNPISFIDPDGKEGIKYTDEDGQKTVESNVVVLLEQKKAVPDGASEKKVARINRQNGKIEKRNTARMADVETRLNETYNGSDGKGSKNSVGETVMFKFNIIGLEVADTKGGTNQNINAIATKNGLNTSSKTSFGTDIVAKAAVVTTRSTEGSLGLSNRVWVTEQSGAPVRTLGHEVGHTLKLDDAPYPGANSGLMDYSGGNGLISSEVDNIWEMAYDK